MSVVAVVACWCFGSCVLAPFVGRAIRFSHADALRAECVRRGKQMLVA